MYHFDPLSPGRSDPKRLASTLKNENEESCTTYNMLKVCFFSPSKVVMNFFIGSSVESLFTIAMYLNNFIIYCILFHICEYVWPSFVIYITMVTGNLFGLPHPTDSVGLSPPLYMDQGNGICRLL